MAAESVLATGGYQVVRLQRGGRPGRGALDEIVRVPRRNPGDARMHTPPAGARRLGASRPAGRPPRLLQAKTEKQPHVCHGNRDDGHWDTDLEPVERGRDENRRESEARVPTDGACRGAVVAARLPRAHQRMKEMGCPARSASVAVTMLADAPISVAFPPKQAPKLRAQAKICKAEG